MAEFQIPRRLRQGVGELAHLTSDQFEQILSFLSRTEPSFSKKKIASAAPSELRASIPNLNDVLDALMAMESYRSFADVSRADLVASLFQSAETFPELSLTAEQVVDLRTRMSALLRTPAIAVTGKAAGVLAAHEHVFVSSRIFTDIRPVFTEGIDDSVAPAAAVMIQMLRIRYLKDGDQKDFFVALDNSDLKKLLATIERAVQKTSIAAEMISKTPMQYLNVDSE